MKAPAPSRIERLARARLYLIATIEDAQSDTWERLRDACASGAIDAIQFRSKTLSGSAALAAAHTLRTIADEAGALYLVNDHSALALAVEADGLHVGQTDLSVVEARRIVGIGRLLGTSTHDRATLAAAVRGEADHAGLGPFFASTTKAPARAPGGFALAVAALRGVPTTYPVFAIGGIGPTNVASLVAVGVTRVAVGAGILAQRDPAAAAAAIALALPPGD